MFLIAGRFASALDAAEARTALVVDDPRARLERVARRLDRSLERGARFVAAAELVEHQRATHVRRGEARLVRDDRLVARERFFPALRSHEERRLADREIAVEAEAARLSLGARARERVERGRAVARVELSDRERVPRRRAVGIERDGPLEVRHGVVRAAPAQEPHAQHALGPRAIGGDLAGLRIRELRLVVATLELVRVAHEDARPALARQQRGSALERLASRHGARGGHARTAEREPRAGLLWVLGGDAFEDLHGPIELAVVERHARAIEGRRARTEHTAQRRSPEEHREPRCPPPRGLPLTIDDRHTTMRAMTRDTLETILAEAPGAKADAPNAKGESKTEAAKSAEKNGDKKSARPPAASSSEERAFTFAEEHRVSLYLSLGDSGTVVNEVVRVSLGAVLRIEQKDRTLLYVEYAAVQGMSVRPPRSTGEAPRTGF